jgi:myo-inositol 2-dehydrogenase / D-chiro-inositol 1-dehydrogenase
MGDLRVGLVGAGWIARTHVETLERLGGTQIVAVCDVDPERAKAVAGAVPYDSWEDLLERETLDVLFICTPPLAHREPAVAALERGLHVFLEKPIARTLEDADAIVSAAERSQAVCAVGYQWHATSVLDDLRSVLEGQEIGMLIGRGIGATQGRPWFLDRAQGGGNILERGSHQIDLARTVAGEVESVQAAASEVQLAQGEGERGDIEDAAALVLRFANGGLGTLLVAWTRAGLPGLYTLDVLASEATLHLTLDPDFSLRGTSRGETVEARSPQHPFERSVARFLEAARAGDPSQVFCTPSDAARTLAVAVACEEALSSGTTVSVPRTPAHQ